MLDTVLFRMKILISFIVYHTGDVFEKINMHLYKSQSDVFEGEKRTVTNKPVRFESDL